MDGNFSPGPYELSQLLGMTVPVRRPQSWKMNDKENDYQNHMFDTDNSNGLRTMIKLQ